MKKVLFGVLFLFLFFFFTKSSLADSDFSTDYNVVYAVKSNADTQVNLDATLTNLTDQYYASSYDITVGFKDIENLKATDSEGSINPTIVAKSSGSTIKVTFNRHVVGKNNKLNFNLSFDTKEVAKNFNNTWDINIPGISSENDFASFNTTVSYPSFLGEPTFIKPTLLNQNPSTGGNTLSFTKQDLGSSGISIAFGNFQVYNFNLKYHLQNTNVFPVTTEIALPPTTNYQDVSVENISPKPLNVALDKDGNWLAKYKLNASQILNITAIGKAKVYISPKQESLSSNSLNDYLKSQKYWESNNPKIIELAKQLKTPFAIYQYVVKNLNYDFSRVETDSPRLGAVGVLQNPNSAVCLEFTDLFVAIARAAGIPAREIDGFAFTNNTSERPLSNIKDILHAWPEYYDFDRKAWIMVDPTWGNTTGGVDYFNTLDFDHIAFVVKGEDSSYPVPAGGYKIPTSGDIKDVNVQVGSTFDPDLEVAKAQTSIPKNIVAGLPISANVTISNIGTTIIKKQEVNVSTNFLTPNSQSVISDNIPPFGSEIVAINFARTPVLTNTTDTIKITVGNNVSYESVKILPFFVNKLFLLGGLLFVLFSIAVSLAAYIYRRISLLRQKRESDLRRQSPQFKE